MIQSQYTLTEVHSPKDSSIAWGRRNLPKRSLPLRAIIEVENDQLSASDILSLLPRWLTLAEVEGLVMTSESGMDPWMAIDYCNPTRSKISRLFRRLTLLQEKHSIQPPLAQVEAKYPDLFATLHEDGIDKFIIPLGGGGVWLGGS